MLKNLLKNKKMKKIPLILALFLALISKGQVQEFCNITHGDNSYLINNPPDALVSAGAFTVRIFVHVITDLHGHGGMTPTEVNNSLQILLPLTAFRLKTFFQEMFLQSLLRKEISFSVPASVSAILLYWRMESHGHLQNK